MRMPCTCTSIHAHACHACHALAQAHAQVPQFEPLAHALSPFAAIRSEAAAAAAAAGGGRASFGGGIGGGVGGGGVGLNAAGDRTQIEQILAEAETL